jgi:hypothetical protein
MGAKNTKPSTAATCVPITAAAPTCTLVTAATPTCTLVTAAAAAATPTPTCAQTYFCKIEQIEYWTIYIIENYYLVRRNIKYQSAFNQFTNFDPSKPKLSRKDINCIKLLVRRELSLHELSLHERRVDDFKFNQRVLKLFLDNNDVSDFLRNDLNRSVKKSLLRKSIWHTYRDIMNAEKLSKQHGVVMCLQQQVSTEYFLDENHEFLLNKHRKIFLPVILRQLILDYLPVCANEHYWLYGRW